ncbi:MAG: hypothetical protein NTZ09_09065 [Candidatus Hydrogenedentes bacterium]|nr:hypothetical protein [Candidatus Hydrogenedentota bacterium]
MFASNTMAVVLCALLWVKGAAEQSNIDQARQGLEQLQQRIGAFRIQLDWQKPASPDPEDQTPNSVSGTFDGARYRCTITRDAKPGAPTLLAPTAHYAYDGGKAVSHFLSDSDASTFFIDSRPNLPLIPPQYSRACVGTPLTEWLAKPGIKELEPVQIGEAICPGFELTFDATHIALRQEERVWLDPANDWLPRRVEFQIISFEGETPSVSDSWTYEVARIAKNEDGVPFAAEISLRWKYGNNEGQRTAICSVYETGLQVSDDLFTMSPPPGAKVVDSFVNVSYTAGDTADTSGLATDVKPSTPAVAPEDVPALQKQQPVRFARPWRREPAEPTPGWPVELAVSIGLAFVVGVCLTIAVRRGRGRR